MAHYISESRLFLPLARVKSDKVALGLDGGFSAMCYPRLRTVIWRVECPHVINGDMLE
jgi:hypothetical protein